MTNQYVNRWTPDIEKRVEDLWRGQNSASVIAEKINTEYGCSFSRNAVIGKIHRLGLQGQGRRPSITDAAVKKREERRAPKKTAAVESYHTEPPRPAQVAAEVVDVEVAPPDNTSPRVSILDIGPGTCRYPIGDPLREDFGFCGAACHVEKPYCTHHHQIAYVPIQPKKKVAWRAHR